jgi:hypothetical protein
VIARRASDIGCAAGSAALLVGYGLLQLRADLRTLAG